MELHIFAICLAVNSLVSAACWNDTHGIGDTNSHNFRRNGEMKPEIILKGPIYQIDDFMECVYKQGNQYCLTEVELKPINETSAFWQRIKEMNRLHTNYRRDLLYVGLCVPNYCQNKDVSEDFSNYLTDAANTLGVSVNTTIRNGTCSSKKDKTFQTLDYITSVIITLVAIVIFCGTVYDGNRRLKNKTAPRTMYGRFLICFSIPANWKRLGTLRDTEDSKSFRCIQGIRSISMYLVIAGHVLYASIHRPLKNPEFIEESYHDFFRSSLCNGQATMSTFFCISGFLLSYFFLKEANVRGSIAPLHILKAIFHRYLRLTPVYAMVILLQATWVDRLGSGPSWSTLVSAESRNCQLYGWTNLLYINNLVHHLDPCLIHSWYLAADFQCYVLSVLVLTLIWKYPRYSKHILCGAVLLWTIVPFVQTYLQRLDPVLMNTPENVKHFPMDKTFHSRYITFHGNAGAYTVGVIFGYFYNYAKREGIKFSTATYILVWTINLTVPWTILVLPFIFYQPEYIYNVFTASIFASISKIIYAAGIGTIVTSFALGYGGIGNTIASWKPFQIFGRLSYTVYLIHPSLLRAEAGAAKDPIYLSEYTLFESWFANVMASSVVALLFCLLFELPSSALTKLFSQDNEQDQGRIRLNKTIADLTDVDGKTKDKLIEDQV